MGKDADLRKVDDSLIAWQYDRQVRANEAATIECNWHGLIGSNLIMYSTCDCGGRIVAAQGVAYPYLVRRQAVPAAIDPIVDHNLTNH